MWNDLCLVGVGKIAPKCGKSFKGRDRTFVSCWLKKRGLQKL